MGNTEIIDRAKSKLERFLGFSFPTPLVIETSIPFYGSYRYDVVIIGYFDNDEDALERTLIHELAHFVQDKICKPKFPYLHMLIEAIPLAFGIGKGKLLRYFQFVEGFATWIDEEIMGYRGDEYWFSVPKYYFKVYYKGAEIFRKMGKEKAIEFGLTNREFCKEPQRYKSLRTITISN
ncbi:hypothetical protein SULI_13365 [Saccharolobus solfataricus]|uniref:Uncharacterized protein n=3 Tax=Saccharolobus solfataricus TaxID=2287 RepID=Q97XD6_SACS2|nr:hypothetical protein [Saccharolobus solfataricus]AAK42005.1 Hypothetical protein SSO1809 [Saccharolobus solfataricus P2]AKA74721.1 hypothetical protein SULB_2626 [Saccharolobus solfataricus]AKA77416.1 hypothetical protein SULC_2622 [Saccharolobus solfataricus]AKA80107.1 hypothetical protein SULA_2625 [Saccharolobus solfataricus]AZF69187.1 hypothetical protein SULG_13365 [Saccharolobus solfataricus]